MGNDRLRERSDDIHEASGGHPGSFDEGAGVAVGRSGWEVSVVCQSGTLSHSRRRRV